jgi:hypothetical protein
MRLGMLDARKLAISSSRQYSTIAGGAQMCELLVAPGFEIPDE